MFIPSNKTEIGTIKTLAKDIRVLKGTFKKGSKVKIIRIGERGYDFIDIDSGEKCIEVSSMWDDIHPFEEN